MPSDLPGGVVIESYASLAARYQANDDIRIAFAMMCHPDSPLVAIAHERARRLVAKNDEAAERWRRAHPPVARKLSPADHHPAMDSDSCDANGVRGLCGSRTCSAFAAGKCPIADEIPGEENDDAP